MRNAYKFYSENLEGAHFRDLDMDRRIMLKCILNRVLRCELESCSSGYYLLVDFSKLDNESSASIKGETFFDNLGNCWLLTRILLHGLS
jgi:hypothetical protein